MGDEDLPQKTQNAQKKSVKSDENKVENNKSAFYTKINGFLFGSFENYRYLCKQKETTLLIIRERAATYKRRKIMNTSCDLLKNSYICIETNINGGEHSQQRGVVICLKIRIFA